MNVSVLRLLTIHFLILTIFSISCRATVTTTTTRPSPPRIAGIEAILVPTRKKPPEANDEAWFSPFVLKVNSSKWPSVKTWNVSLFNSYFASFTDLYVPISKVRKTDFKTCKVPYEYSNSKQTWKPFGDAYQQLHEYSTKNSDTTFYMNQFPLEAILYHAEEEVGKQFRSDIRFFSALRQTDEFRIPYKLPNQAETFSQKFVWFGNSGTRSGLHFDVPDNFHAMMNGHKTVVLFPPEDSPYLYPYPDIPTKSQIDPLCHTSNEFPLLTNTQPRYFHLEPGDILFIPRLWWHWLESTSSTTSVNWWHYPTNPWVPYLIPRKKKKNFSANQIDYDTESITEYSMILYNKVRLKRYLNSVGAPGFCRSWFSIVSGFLERIVTGKEPHHVGRLYCPTNTLVFTGQKYAELKGLTVLDNTIDDSNDDDSNDDDGNDDDSNDDDVMKKEEDNDNDEEGGSIMKSTIASCNSNDSVMLKVKQFRTELINKIYGLIKKSHLNILTEDEITESLESTLDLLKGSMKGDGEEKLILPSLDCHFDALFNVYGGIGPGWDDCNRVMEAGDEVEINSDGNIVVDGEKKEKDIDVYVEI
jgi:hypothetical protein